MPKQIGATRQLDRLILRLSSKEKTLLSIILMNHGEIPETRLKRIYLEKNTFWDLQSSKIKLTDLGFLKKEKNRETGESVYTISSKLHEILAASLSSNTAYKNESSEYLSENQTCCQEYSILWYLAQLDNETNFKATSSNKGKVPRLSLQKTQDILGVDEDDAKYIMYLLNKLSKNEFFKKNGIKKWNKTLKEPYDLIKRIYKMVYYELRENGSLGIEDVGKDNIDFLIDELEGLKVGIWYPLGDFINNLKNTLFSANQPFRWIHFEERSVWNILNREFRLIGLVQTAQTQDDLNFFTPTALGAYSFGGISEEEFQDIIKLRKSHMLVHPNFEITLVSKEIHPEVLLELSLFTDPVKLDTMSVFKISRESTQKGLGFGLTKNQMIVFLNEQNKGELPQNVQYSILDWGT